MYPTPYQWALLETYKQYPIPLSPLQFLQIYDELSYGQLAVILGCQLVVLSIFCAIALRVVIGSVRKNTAAP